MTNVFISWSGDRSKLVAEKMREWIPSVLQFATPYFTPADVEKGARWQPEISKKLSDSNVGIICLTKENLDRPWILFEAGALSKNVDQSRVCCLLFGVENSDLAGPLSTFQSTQFVRDEFRKLISTINDAGGDRRLSSEVLDRTFSVWWPQLELAVHEILAQKYDGSARIARTEREMIEEILELSRASLGR